MTIRTTIFLILATLIISCQKNRVNSFQPRSGDDIAVTLDLEHINFETVSMDTFAYDVSYISPEATDGSYMNSYDKIIVCGDTLFILDKGKGQEAIFSFNRQGKFLFKIDRRGKGPGEYLNIDDFYVNYKSGIIGVLCQSRILKYNFHGDFVELLNLKEHSILDIEQKDSLLYCRCAPKSKSNTPLRVAVFTTKGKLLYKDYPQPKEIANFSYCKGNYMAHDGQNCLVNLLCADTIYQFETNSILPIYILNFGKYKLPPKDLNELLMHGAFDSDYINTYFSKNKYVRFGLHSFSFTDEFLVLKYPVDKELKTVIYSKKTGNLLGFESDHTFYSKYVNCFDFKVFDSKSFYGLIPIEVAMNIRQMEENNMKKNNDNIFKKEKSEFYRFIKPLNINSNPIIMIYKIKEF